CCCSPCSRTEYRESDDLRSALQAEDLEHVGEVIEFLAGGRRGAADEVENLAVLQAVIGEALDAPFLVEIDGDNPLVGDPLRHEGGLFAALGNIVEHLAAHGGDRRGRAEHDQYLLLGGAERDLLERSVSKHIAALIGLGEAAAEWRAERQENRQTAERARAT